MLEKSKLTKEIEKRKLASYANSTRWSNFLYEIVDLHLQSRIKHIFSENPTNWNRWILPVKNYIEHLELGPIPFSEIEWLEIDTKKENHRGVLIPSEIVDFKEEVNNALRNSKLNGESEGKYLKIWGYR